MEKCEFCGAKMRDFIRKGELHCEDHCVTDRKCCWCGEVRKGKLIRTGKEEKGGFNKYDVSNLEPCVNKCTPV